MSEVLMFEDFLHGGYKPTLEAKPYTDQPRITGTAEIADKLEVPHNSVTSINHLRALQTDWLNRESKQQQQIRYPFGVSSLMKYAVEAEVSEAASIALSGALDGFNRRYLSQFMPETDPGFESQLNFLNDYSINTMDDMTYLVGPLTNNGSRDHTKAGINQVIATWQAAGGKLRTIVPPTSPEPSPEPEPEPVPEPTPEPEPTPTPGDEKEKLYEEKKQALNNARVNLAKLQTDFRHKFGWNGRKRRDDLADAKAAYEEAVREHIKAGFDVIREENPGITRQEVQQLALTAYANEFQAMLNEQKKPEYVDGTYGRAVRKLGSMSLPKKIALSTLVAGASAAAAITGGVAMATSAIGFLGYRVGKTIIRGPVGHNTESGTNRILGKVTKKTDEAAKRDIEHFSRGSTDEQFASIIGGHILRSAERIDRSDRNRRMTSAGITIASLVPGLIGTIHKIQGAQEIRSSASNPLRPDRDRLGLGDSTPSGEANLPGDIEAPSVDSVADTTPSSTPNIGGEVADMGGASAAEIQYGWNPLTGDLFRSEIHMPVLDGQGFAFDVEDAGLVPKGRGYEFALYLHSLGLDDGAHIPGFKDLGMWHTSTGYSNWSTDAARALWNFNSGNY